MARTARTDARSQPAVAVLLAGLLAAGLLGGAWPAGAQEGSGGSPTPAGAGRDSLALLAQASESGTASPSLGGRPGAKPAPAGAQALEPGSGFTLRRVPNPRYRSPVVPPGAGSRALGTLLGTQYARAQITRRESGPASSSTDWQIAAGRQSGELHGIELWAAGLNTTTYDELRELRLASRQGALAWSIGDVVPQPLGTLPWIQRLRGGALAHALLHGSDWRLMGGVVPTYSHSVMPNSGLGAFMVDHLPIDDRAALSLGLMGFGRGAPQTRAIVTSGSDTLAGGGGAALYAARVLSPFGEMSSTFMAQVHTLDGRAALAGLQAVEWILSRPTIAFAVRDQVGTRNARQPGTEHLSLAPSHEGRLSLQARLPSGRVEAHVAGLISAGTEVAGEAQTVQAGVSGNIGHSGWYSGLDFSWNRRAPLFDDERRLAIQTGRVSERGSSLLMRLERNVDNLGRDQLQFTGEASTGLGGGLRVALEPRLDWDARQFERGLLSARLGWPLLGPATRMNATVTMAHERDDGFAGRLSEASVAISFAPRARDRGGLEVRRLDEGAVPSFEYTGAYDLQAERYAGAAGALAAPRTGTLTVTVTHADSSNGVPDVLVSLDGKEFRFTDGDGVARFTDAPPGSHVVSIVERSLPATYRVTGTPTAFVTIESGRVPDPVRFEVARPVRRVKF